MIPVGRLAPLKQWDCNMFELLVSNRLYPTGLEFRSWDGYPGYPQARGCVLQVPGRYWAAHTDQINEAIKRYEWLLLVRTSDEEDLFDVRKIVHPNVKFWVQTPRVGRDYGDARLFGVGYPPHFNDLPKEPPDKSLDVFLSAQTSNGLPGDQFRLYERRARFFDVLKAGSWVSELVERGGFAQGDRAEYVAGMLSAKVAPAPTGTVSVDSFRFAEALEAHAVPVADAVSDVDGVTDYWHRLYPGAPFPILRDTEHLPMIVDGLVDGWPANSNRVAAFWMRYKRELSLWLKTDLQQLGAL